ncbi:MAG: M23 family metallopeptidase [Stappiaceae bacterium]
MHLGRHPHAPVQSVELGNEEPIVLHDDRQLPTDRRSVSYRWLSGTVLTGMTSVFLIGGALFAALDGQYTFAAVPDASIVANNGAGGSDTQSAQRKGDRQTKLVTQVSDRQTLQINTLKREGDRDHVKVRPFAFVSSTLDTRKVGEFADRIPPFNPLKLSQIGSEEVVETASSDAIYNAKVEGDVTISVLDFPLDSPLINTELSIAEADVEKIIREEAKFVVDGTVNVASLTTVDPNRFDFGLANESDFSKLNIKIETENVSFIQKSGEVTGVAGLDEVYTIFEEGADLRDILASHGATEQETASAIGTLERQYSRGTPEAGQRLRLALAPVNDGSGRIRPIRLSIYSDNYHEFTAALTDMGIFAKAEEPSAIVPSEAFAAAERTTTSGPTPSIYRSLYQTALQQEIPDAVINELVRIYSFDVDFNSRIKPGDTFEVLYNLDNDIDDATPEILYTSLTAGGQNLSFYRHRTPENGVVDYYDRNGKSAKKFLIRKPIAGGSFRSGFGMRRHPILGYRKMHTGVDWAAPRGTRILASGNGKITKASWASGYGRRVEIQHSNGYLSTYSHMTGFAKGIKKGGRVKQGQVIGYVGSTGLSTGPHLHYEVKINNRFVNPMRIRLPRGQELDGENLKRFKHEIAQLRDVMDSQTAATKLAIR